MASSRSKLLDLPLECGPAVRGHSNPITLQKEVVTLREAIIQLFPEISLDSSVFHPTWVWKESITYKANNYFLICGSDGLDPKFVKLDELIVLGGSTLVFVTRECSFIFWRSFSFMLQMLQQTKHWLICMMIMSTMLIKLMTICISHWNIIFLS